MRQVKAGLANSSDWVLLHVVTALELGGAQRATLAQAARAPGPFVARYLVAAPGPLEQEVRNTKDIHYISLLRLKPTLTPWHDALAFMELVAIMQKLRRRYPRCRLLVHTHSSKAGIVGRAAARLVQADVIVHTAHGFGHVHYVHGWTRPFLLLAERSCGAWTSGFTTDSEATRRDGWMQGLFGEAPVRVAYCGIDVESFSAKPASAVKVRAELGIPESAPVVLNVSCLKRQKDPIAFVHLARLVSREQPGTRFLIAGDGPMRPAVEDQIRLHGLQRQVQLLGWRHDIASLMHLCDLLVLTSRWEGLPQTLVQAMAAGRAIVARDVDGVGEAVLHEDNGLLYGVDDLDRMARGVLELLGDPERRARMGERGRQRASVFSEGQMLRQVGALYAELMRPL